MKTEIFESNPNLKEVHMTSDGQCFYNDNDAKMHAKTLESKTVELVMNPKFLNEIEVAEAKELNEEAPALEDMTKQQLVDFAKLNFNVELSAKSTKNELLNSIDELLKEDAPKEDAPKEDAPAEQKEEIKTQE